jgi:hypothetical protein
MMEGNFHLLCDTTSSVMDFSRLERAARGNDLFA